MPPFHEQYQEIYSISDLHLSVGEGVDGVATSGLVSTIAALRARAVQFATDTRHQTAALVVNGDTVDFLSVPDAKEFDPQGAPKKLKDIFDANESFWDALAAFADQETVVLTLGNHDVELALPECQALLRKRIGGRLILAFDGAGYRCRVGNTTALFLHGNNQDEWNQIDFDRLGRIAAALNAGKKKLESWPANEGTKLVIEALNEQKKKHPFIEFLKPEGPWLLTLIAKLGFLPLARQGIDLGWRNMKAWGRGGLRKWTDANAYLEGRAGGAFEVAAVFEGDELLIDADRRYREGYRLLKDGSPEAGNLGGKDLFRRERAADEEIRQHIVDSLLGQTAFLTDQSDTIYDRLAPKLGGDVHWVVCGHTHLRRSHRHRSDRVYFNSGTWMRLMDLYDAAEQADQLPKVLEALDATTTKQLDSITWEDANKEQRHIVHREPTVVMLKATPTGADGWLANGLLPNLTFSFDDPVARTLRSVTP